MAVSNLGSILLSVRSTPSKLVPWVISSDVFMAKKVDTWERFQKYCTIFFVIGLTCPKCKFVFASSKSMREHHNRKHKYKCDRCYRWYLDYEGHKCEKVSRL